MTAAATTAKNVITHLSFTRYKKLDHSPLALYRYINQADKDTKAKTEGLLLDCKVFTPNDFEKQFFVMPSDIRKPTAAQVNAKKPSAETMKQIERWNDLKLSIGKKKIVTPAQIEHADFLADCFRNNATVAFHGLLNPDFFKFQVPIEFFYKGFKHKGIKDADGHDRNAVRTIWDLKKMGKASGERKVAYEIRSNLLALQGAIYCHPEDEKKEPIQYYVMAIDNEGYVTPFRIGRDARDKARIEWNRLISAAHRLNMDEDLSQGPEFWGDSDGFFDY